MSQSREKRITDGRTDTGKFIGPHLYQVGPKKKFDQTRNVFVNDLQISITTRIFIYKQPVYKQH